MHISQDTLFISCVDARMPIDKLLPPNSAVIKRNIAALVPEPEGKGGADMLDTLKYALKQKKIKRIVVMGHTDCGGICACMDQPQGLPKVLEYMSPLNKTREEIAQADLDKPRKYRRLEQDGVRKSIENLRRYSVVQEAEAAGLTIEGWLLDVRDQTIHKGLEKADHPRYLPALEESTLPFPPHMPEALYLGCVEAPESAHNMFLPGSVLVKRNLGADVPDAASHKDGREEMEATLEFALKAKGIRRILVMGHKGCDVCACGQAHDANTPEALEPWPNERQALGETLANLKTYPVVREALADKEHPLEMQGMLYDGRTRSTYKYDDKSGSLHAGAIQLGLPAERKGRG